LTIVILEIFGLVFLIFKLFIFPLVKMIVKHCCRKKDDISPPVTKESVHEKEATSDLDDIDLHF
jgi:hypothetical protein